MKRLDVPKDSLPPPSTRSLHNRRKYVRYKAKEGALVSPVAKSRKYWRILDVSLGGMSFRYIPCEDLNGFSEIDIVNQESLLAEFIRRYTLPQESSPPG